ncbi:MAG: hypothetical protein L3J73_02690, partial [Thermoplasmata archaeon]|nr:hypothetical protein [Thermoplasmata archaeon]
TTAQDGVGITVLPTLAPSFAASVGAPYCRQGSGVALVTVNASATGGVGADTYLWSFPNNTAAGANATSVVSAGAIASIQVTVTDSQSHSASTTQSITVSSVSCATSSGSPLAGSDWLIFLLIALVAAVIAVELVLLLRRKKA